MLACDYHDRDYGDDEDDDEEEEEDDTKHDIADQW